MNENIGQPAFAQRINSIAKKKDVGSAVFGSALEDSVVSKPEETIATDTNSSTEVKDVVIDQSDSIEKYENVQKNKRGSKVLASSERFSDKENLKHTKFEKANRSNTKKRNSSILYDIDIYYTLTDLKRNKGLKMNEYCNDAIREKLAKDYPEIYKKNYESYKQ